MQTLKTLGIINLVATAITFLAVYGGAEDITVGLWVFVVIGLAVTQSIIGIVSK